MRDRLIALIKESEDRTPCAFDPECDCEGKKCGDCEREAIADHLLANGVLALPVKIGQTIYRMNIYNDAYREATVVAIYYAEDKKYHPKPHILVHHGNERGRLRINFSDFGKTVFLTKEEAEAALAERSGE